MEEPVQSSELATLSTLTRRVSWGYYFERLSIYNVAAIPSQQEAATYLVEYQLHEVRVDKPPLSMEAE